MSDTNSQQDPEEVPELVPEALQNEGKDEDDNDEVNDLELGSEGGSEAEPRQSEEEEYYDVEGDDNKSERSFRRSNDSGKIEIKSLKSLKSTVAFIDKYDDVYDYSEGPSQYRPSNESGESSAYSDLLPPHEHIKVNRLYSYAATEDFHLDIDDRSDRSSEALEEDFETDDIMESMMRWGEPNEMSEDACDCESRGKPKMDEINKLLSTYEGDDEIVREPVNLDKATPYSYLVATGMIPVLRKLIQLMANKRPRCPFMSTDQCAALYMGYFLKTLNMNCSDKRRQKYQNAMLNLEKIKSSTDTLLSELPDYYGRPFSSLPDRLRKQFEDFINLEHLPIEQIVLYPKIPGMSLGYDAVPDPFTDHQVTRKVVGMLDQLKMVDLIHKLGAFEIYSSKKNADRDAAERAAYHAIEATDLVKKVSKIKKEMKKEKAKKSKESNQG